MNLLEIILLIPFGSGLLYLTLLSLFSANGKLNHSFKTSRQRKFAIVVPAHNEEPTIERTVRSLLAVEYPSSLYDIVVVADNCSDRTAEIAANLGAHVLERNDPVLRGKGYALRWSFDVLLSGGHAPDGIAVIDADSVVSTYFLLVLNYYIEHGAKAIQCSDLVLPSPGSWSSEIIRLGFTLYNYVRPLGRRLIACSAGLRGNGMCFDADTLRRVPWNAFSLSEDLEYGLELLLHGVRVDFAPEAVVWATMPQQSVSARSQRARWEMGRFPVIKKYALALLRAAAAQRSFCLLDALIDLMMPPIMNTLMIVLLIIAIHLIMVPSGVEGASTYFWLWSGVLLLGGVHVLVGMIAAKADHSLYQALFHIPRYAIWKIALYAGLIFKGKPKEWIRTTRESQNPLPHSLTHRS